MEYLAGKLNVLADCLSRMPSMKKFNKEELEELREMEELVCRSTTVYWETNNHPCWEEYYEVGSHDRAYMSVVEAVKNHVPFDELRRDHHARIHKKVYDDISLIQDNKGRFLMTVNGERMIVPQKKRRMLLNVAHVSHSGFENTNQTIKE